MKRPSLSTRQWSILLSICAAGYGLAAAVSTYDVWLTKAPAGQLPGYMTTQGLDGHASFHFFAMLVILPIAAALLLRPFVRMLSAADSRVWARIAAAGCLISALGYCSVARQFWWTVLPATAGFVACVLLRRLDARFCRRDWIMVVTMLPVYVALADVTTLPVEQILPIAAALVFALRLVLVPIRPGRALAASYCFAFAPLSLVLQTHFFGRDQRYLGWPALAIALASPVAMRLLARDSTSLRRRLRVAVALVIYPLASFAYADAVSLTTAEGRPRVSFFEDAQHLTPAAEVLRGETPYRDIVPVHGLITDSLLDVWIVRATREAAGPILKARGIVTTLIAPALYFVTFGATGAAEAAILAVIPAVCLGFMNGAPRFTMAVVVLAFAVAAVRRRNRHLIALAGALAILAVFVSLDAGLYSLVTVAFAVFRFGATPKERLRGAAWCCSGATASFAVICLLMGIGGYLIDFFRVTLLEVATLGPVYALLPFEGAPPAMLTRFFPEILTAFLDPRAMTYLIWAAAIVTVAVMLAAGVSERGRRRGSIDALMVTAVWIVIAGISYAERQHIYFHFVIPAFVAIAAVILLRARSAGMRKTGVALAVSLFLLSNVISHAAITTYLRRVRGPIDRNVSEVGLPRAAGALFANADIGELDSVYRYARTHLGPGDTFFDFTNRGLLYFLLDRDVPVRQIEVAGYEPERMQREVIARIAANPRIRFAIVPGAEPTGVDYVPNWQRAPLVAAYLRAHFAPDLEEAGIVIWRRTDSPGNAR